MSRMQTGPENTKINQGSSRQKSKALHALTEEQLQEWIAMRREIGRIKYGNAHLKRYNAVDVMEELIDSINILNLYLDRVRREGVEISASEHALFGMIQSAVTLAMGMVMKLDEVLPDHVRTDEKGGHRIWWTG